MEIKRFFLFGLIIFVTILVIMKFTDNQKLDPCELKTGSKSVDDYYVSNRDTCYGERAYNGDYSACLKAGSPVECLVAVSQYRKELVCDQVSDNVVREKCIDYLFTYYSFNNISSYKGMERIIRREIVLLKENDTLPYVGYVKVRNNTLQVPGYSSYPGGILELTRWDKFDCNETDGEPKKITARVFIDSCETTKEGVRVTFIHIE